MMGKVKIMGVLNVTPDSFYNGGKYTTVDKALKRVEEMVNDGADIIDVGGESTRPGSTPVSVDEELGRVIPVIQEVKKRFNVTISVDTYKSKVAEEAVCSGATIVNDVYALRYDEKMIEIVKKYDTKIVLMHMQGTPQTMQINPQYEDVVKEIRDFLEERINFCLQNGIAKQNIIIDPGIGFGKTTLHNLQILKNLNEFKKLDVPLLVGVSRKSFIGRILGSENSPIQPEERLVGSLAVQMFSILNGVDIIRTHDVKETFQTIKILSSILES